MNKLLPLACVSFFLTTSLAFAACDVTNFRWECDMPVQHAPKKNTTSLVSCGTTNLYVTKQQYLTLMRYQRANISMVLKVNGEFLDAPCVAREYDA